MGHQVGKLREQSHPLKMMERAHSWDLLHDGWMAHYVLSSGLALSSYQIPKFSVLVSYTKCELQLWQSGAVARSCPLFVVGTEV
jgi:hypothetical protein